MTDKTHYNDLTALFEQENATLYSQDLQNTVMGSVRSEEKRRRFVLSGFGLCGGLIAASQLPFLITFLQELNSSNTLDAPLFSIGSADISSITLWTLLALLGLGTLVLTTVESA